MSTSVFAYLVEMDTEFEPFEDPIETETPDQETPGDLTTGDRLSLKVKMFLIPVIGRFEALKVLDYLSRPIASYTDDAEVILKDIDNDGDYREVGSMMDLVLGCKAYGFHVLLFVQLMFGFDSSSRAVKDSLFVGEEYDKVFNHLDMSHAPLEGKVLILTIANQETPGDLTIGDHLSPKVNMFLIPVIGSTPPTRHAEESEDSNMFGARSMPSDFTAPLLPDHPLTHTTPTLVPFLCRTARMDVHVLPMMSPGLSASIADVAAMSDSTFRKRFRSSYKSSPSSSPPDLRLQKHSWGTSKLVEDDKEEDEEDEDEEVEESLDSDSESEDAEDEGPTARDEGLVAGDKNLGMIDESLGLGGDEAVPEGQQRAAPIVETAMGEPLGLGYRALRRWEIASREGQMPSVFEVGQGSGSVLEPKRPARVLALRQPTLTTWIDPEDGSAYIDVPTYPPLAPHVQTPPSPEWSSGSLLVSPAPSIVPSPISSPMIPLTVPLPVASPATAEDEGFLTELGAQVEMQGGLIHDHMI
ncbi:hypothetical protein Tco_1222464 [Tanacetum coccineum]